LAHTVERVKR